MLVLAKIKGELDQIWDERWKNWTKNESYYNNNNDSSNSDVLMEEGINRNDNSLKESNQESVTRNQELEIESSTVVSPLERVNINRLRKSPKN